MQEPLPKWHTLFAITRSHELFCFTAIGVLPISRAEQHFPRVIRSNWNLQLCFDIWVWCISESKSSKTSMVRQRESIDILHFGCAYEFGWICWSSLLQLLIWLVRTLGRWKIKFLALHYRCTDFIWGGREKSWVPFLLFRGCLVWATVIHFTTLIIVVHFESVCAFEWPGDQRAQTCWKLLCLRWLWPLSTQVLSFLLVCAIFIYILNLNSLSFCLFARLY